MYIDFDRLDKLIEETGKTKSHLCRSIGKTRYYLRDAKKFNLNVPGDVIETLAAELGTTADYLAGQSDIKEKPPAESGDIRKQAEEMIARMDQGQLLEFIAMATEKLRQK